VNQGSGRGDLRYLVPTAGHTWTSDTWFVLYSQWGTTSGTAGNFGTGGYASDGGFEEWKVRKAPNLSILKTANPAGPVNAGDTIGFDITVSNTGAADATNVQISDPLPASDGATTGTLNWSENPDNSNCAITGSVGSQVLNCTFATLASGTSVTIHIQSATTAADCGVVSNTATLVGDGSSTATVTVQCSAIRILKQSTKTGFPLVSDAGDGALFTVTPFAGGGAAFTVRDNNDPSAGGKSDEITGATGFGEVCISGLAPGNYTVVETTPPSGYGAGTTIQGTAVAVVGTSCTAPNKPTDANSAIFRNPPLGEITVGYHDLGSGETSATSITCAPSGGANITPQAATDDDDITGYLEAQAFTFNPVTAPATYVCTLVVDP
jgi:uncharacterized repeat protein (TIGR01451 family)